MFLIASVALLCALAADPLDAQSLAEQMREGNTWRRLGRSGQTQYFMIAQPAASERARASGGNPRTL